MKQLLLFLVLVALPAAGYAAPRTAKTEFLAGVAAYQHGATHRR